MKYIKLFENFNKTFVGYHCTNEDYEEYDGEISSDYSDRFSDILKLLKTEKSNYYLNLLEKEPRHSIGIISKKSEDEITNYFKEIGLQWIFVDEEKPLCRYGKNCYSVYFNDINSTLNMKDYNEEESDYSYIYFYNPCLLT